MNTQNVISQKMEKIKTLFQTSKDFVLEHSDINVVLTYLEKTDEEFRSVAYEGASMALALKDFQKENKLDKWNGFAEGFGKNHAAQIHAGLGWALAQERKPALLFNDSLEPLMRYRVVDGYGYYDGIFRQRQTNKNQKLPADLTGIALRSYDQGIGRSIWYSCKGDLKMIVEVLNKFDNSRLADLWRGIGIASTYVGGLNEKQLKELFSISSIYQSQLATGAALVARARIQSDTLTPDIENACNVWCNHSATETVSITEKLLPASSDNAYEKWISAIEKEFVSSEIVN